MEKVQHESGRTYIEKLTRRLKYIAWLRTTGLMDIIVFGVRWSGFKFQLGKQDITTVVPMRNMVAMIPNTKGCTQDHTRSRFRTTS